MSQSALIAGVLFAMFLVFVAINGRLATYTDVLWGGGGKGGGTLPPGKAPADPTSPSSTSSSSSGNLLDPAGDGFDAGDMAHLVAALMPYPFDVPFKLAKV